MHVFASGSETERVAVLIFKSHPFGIICNFFRPSAHVRQRNVDDDDDDDDDEEEDHDDELLMSC